MDQASVLLQYRQEAMKRKFYWDSIRRGDNGDFGPGLSPTLKNELLARAPGCFYGPLPTNQSNLVNAFGWFDVSPNCAWRTWSSGPNAGTPITHEYLGGVDSAIWAVKDEIADFDKTHHGRQEEEEWAAAAGKYCTAAQMLAPAAGRSDTIPELQAFKAAATATSSDKTNVKTIEISLPQ
jgi:hypothetical protein